MQYSKCSPPSFIMLSAFVFLIIVAVTLVPISPCDAQVTVRPLVVEVVASPWSPVGFSLSISNPTPVVYEVASQIADLDLSPVGFPQSATEKRERGASSWLSITPDRFRLDGNQEVRIVGKLAPPRNASGTYSAIISWAFVGKRADNSESKLNINVAVIAVVRGGQPARPLVAIQSIDLIPGESGAKKIPCSVRARVMNSGTLHVKVKGVVSIKRIGGEIVATLPVTSGSGFLLPGCTRELTGQTNESLTDGVYIALASVRPEGMNLEARRVSYFLVKNGKVEAQPPDEAGLKEIARLLPPVTCSRVIIRDAVVPGGRRIIPIQASNHTEKPVLVSLAIVAAPADGTNNEVLPLNLPADRCRPDWFTVSSPEVTVAPERPRSFSVTAAIPRDAEGEYYAYLAIKPVTGPEETSLPANYALIAVEVQKTRNEEVEIQDIMVRSPGRHNSVYSVKLKNKGNVLVAVSGSLSLHDSKGKELEKVAFSQPAPLLPSCDAKIDLPIDRLLAPGSYKARAIMTLEKGNVVTKEIAFVVK